MSGLSGVGGGFNPYAAQQFQQNLFSQIDGNGDGSVSKTELEGAVGKAGGSTQAADALYSALDPTNSGGFNEQQFSQVLPGPGMSQGMQAQMIGYQAQGWPGASQGGQVAQSLFSQIDANGDGSISQAELEKAVTGAGGTKEAADALYAKLDPNNTGSVSEQQFSQSLSQAMPHGHHHHHHGGGTEAASSDGSATDALTSLFNADGGGAANSPTQIAQNMFTQTDSNGDGVITQSELEQSVTAAGGDKAGADALFAKLDTNGTGSVSEQQFVDTLQPPSTGGNTAQDALLALLDQLTQSNAAPPVSSAGGVGTTGTTSAIGTGNTARDALSALVQGFDPATATHTGNSARDAIAALLHPSDGSSNGAAGTATAGGFSSTDFTHALSLYQSQLEQQLMAGISATQSASLVTA